VVGGLLIGPLLLLVVFPALCVVFLPRDGAAGGSQTVGSTT